jgi:N-acetylneuraminate synthase
VNNFIIDNFLISQNSPPYFIADIAANHDGDIARAKELIYLAAEAGANAAKFQHFTAKTIVSDVGFKSLGKNLSHQKTWKKSVFEVYNDASLKLDWTETLRDVCEDAGIAFLTSPYSFEIVDAVDPFVPAYKIGSGDITWIELIKYIAGKHKPYILATGASTLEDVDRAVHAAMPINNKLCLMQCNTNYTASLENFKFIHLNVLKLYRQLYPDLVLGLSDHTPGLATVLGAITLGARVIEKHFTDDKTRIGPDHAFSMSPTDWREMVTRSMELHNALGSTAKKVEENENETSILQRRAIRLRHDLKAGSVIQESSCVMLRPCPTDGLPPYDLNEVLGKELIINKAEGEHLRWTDLR